MNRSNAVLWYILAIGLTTVGVLNSATAFLDRPEVRVTYPTEQCVEVVDYRAKAEKRKSDWSCDNLPPKYSRIYVY